MLVFYAYLTLFIIEYIVLIFIGIKYVVIVEFIQKANSSKD